MVIATVLGLLVLVVVVVVGGIVVWRRLHRNGEFYNQLYHSFDMKFVRSITFLVSSNNIVTKQTGESDNKIII